MKLGIAALALYAAILTTPTAAASSPAPRPRLTEELRRVVEDRASTNAKESAAPSATSDALLLPRLEVREVYRPPLRQPESIIREDRPFTWRDGGTLLKHRGRHVTTELKFQYNPRAGGFDILSFSW